MWGPRRVQAESNGAGGSDRPLLEEREKWRTPSCFGSILKDKPAFYFPVKVAHLPWWNPRSRKPRDLGHPAQN